MRRIVLFLPLMAFVVIALIFWFGLHLNPTELPSALLNKSVPEFSLPSLQNEKRLITEQQLQTGEPVLLNVWATWCPSCKAEHAQLNRIAQFDKIKIFGINYKDERYKAKLWLKRYLNPYEFNVYDHDGRLGLDLGVYGAPETYILDANGVIRYKHVGPLNEKTWATMRAIVQKLKALPMALNADAVSK